MALWLHSVKWNMNDNFQLLDCFDKMAFLKINIWNVFSISVWVCRESPKQIKTYLEFIRARIFLIKILNAHTNHFSQNIIKSLSNYE